MPIPASRGKRQIMLRNPAGGGGPSPPLTYTDTFDSNVDGWTAGPSTALSWDAGTLRIANQIGVSSYAFIEIPVTPGIPYTATVLNAGAGNSEWKVGTTQNGSEYGIVTVGASATGSIPFTPTGSTVFLTYRNSFNGQFSARNADNVAVEPV